MRLAQASSRLATSAIFRRGYATAQGLVMPDIGLNPGDAIPGLLSKEAVQIAWFDYHRGLLNEINVLLQSQPQFSIDESTAQLLTESLSAPPTPPARRLTVLLSQAYMNEFFFRTLKQDGHEEKADIPENLSEILNSDFGSLEALKDTAMARGSAIFGNGAVWLVGHRHHKRLVNTYSWGTPFSHVSTDAAPSTSMAAVFETDEEVRPQPLLCLNAWSHIYIPDYGVAGKQRYLENLWKTIDWNVVAKRAQPKNFSII